MHISVADLKKNYANLNVEFDLWKGESDAQAYIPDMIERLKKEGYAHIDDGALVSRCTGRVRYKRDTPVYDPEIRRRFFVWTQQIWRH